MCLSPVKIKNSRLDYREGVDADFLYVPCGKCPECLNDKRNDIYVRLWSEYNLYHRLGGCVMFVTLSYDRYSRPFVNFRDAMTEQLKSFIRVNNDEKWIEDKYSFLLDKELDNVDTWCFDKASVRDFFKKLSHINELPSEVVPAVVRSGIVSKTKYPIRHFCVCEFGGKRRMPHYHVLLFFPYQLSAFECRRLCEFCWSTRIKESDVPLSVRRSKDWRGFQQVYDNVSKSTYFVYSELGKYNRIRYQRLRGFVMFSKKGAELLSSKGTDYLTKYLSKRDEFDSMTNQNFDDIKCLPSPTKLKELGFIDLAKHVKRFKDSLPFYLISNDVGIDLIREFELDKRCNSSSLFRKSIFIQESNFVYKVPSYIIRRLFFQNRHYVNSDGKKVYYRYLSEFGQFALIESFKYKFENLYKMYSFVATDSFRSFLDNKSFDVAPYTTELFYQIYRKTDLELLTLYSICFRNVRTRFLVSEYGIDLTDSVDKDNLFYYAKRLFNFKIRTYNVVPSDLVDEDGVYLGSFIPRVPHLATSPLCNGLGLFSGFDELLDTMYCMQNYVRTKVSDEREKKRRIYEECRRVFNEIDYKFVLFDN